MSDNISIFRAAEGTPLDEYKLMQPSYSPEVLAGITQLYDAGVSDGYASRVLFSLGDTDGFSLIYAWFKSNFPLTAHFHDVDCLYFVMGGELKLGKGVSSAVLRAGDGFFVPAGQMYGYTAGAEGVEVLEFRSASKFNIEYKGQAPATWATLAASIAANRALWRIERPPELRALR